MSKTDGCKDGTSKLTNNGVCDVNDMLHLHNSTADDNENNVSVCANCGKEGSNLKTCTACKLVKYCNSENVKLLNRPQHKKECRNDIELFKQPPPNEDCPICFLRMPTLWSGSSYMTCCGKMVCTGCIHAPGYDKFQVLLQIKRLLKDIRNEPRLVILLHSKI